MAIKISDNLQVNANKPADAKFGPYAQVGTAPVPAVVINTTTSASSTTAVVAVTSTTGIIAGQTVTGTGVGASITVLSIAGSNVTLSAAVNVASGAAITFTTPAVAASTNPAYKATTTVACDTVIQVYRHKGLTVGLLQADGSIKEYWWKDGVLDNQLVPKGGLGGETTVDIRASISAGAIGVNATVPAGTDLEEFIKQLLQQEIPPTFTVPTASIAISPSALTYEMGTRIPTLAATVTYNAGDGGTVSTVSVQRNDVQYDTKLVADPIALTANGTGDMFDASVVTSGGVANKVSNEPFLNSYPNPYATSRTVNTNQITVRGIHPWFYGTHTGTAGSDTIPTLTSGNIYAGTGSGGGITITSAKVVATVTSEITVPDFGSANPAFLWFAVPAGSKTFGKWYRNEFDQGSIGLSTDLFRTKTTVSVTSTTRAADGGTEWTLNYDVYITNYRTTSTGGNNASTKLS